MLSEKQKFIFIIILQVASLFFIIGFKELGWINDVALRNVYEYKEDDLISTDIVTESERTDVDIWEIDNTPTLVGWWEFDEVDNSMIVNDSTGNGLDGEINSSGHTWLSDNECINNGCLDLEGSTAIDFTIPRLRQYSFSGWIKKTRDIFDETQILSTSDDNAGVTIYDDQTILFFDHGILKSNSITEAGTFYHVVVTNDGKNKKIYINGELEGLGRSNGYGIDAGRARFGVTGVNKRNLYAIIDDFRIYDAALSEYEVINLYNEAGQ